MKPFLSGSWYLLFFASIALSLSRDLCVAATTAGNEPTSQTVKAMVDEKAGAIRARLQDQFSKEDCTLLMAKKESTDSFFLPLFLPYEMQQADTPDFCRSMRYEYSSSPVVYKHAVNFTEFFGQLFSIGSLNDTESVSFDLRQLRYPYIGPEYPIAMQANVLLNKNSCIVNTSWYEPYLANRDLDFMAHPECLMFGWDREKSIVWPRMTNIKPITEDLTPNVNFNNPSYVYSLFDGLRLRSMICSAFIDGKTNSCSFSSVESADHRLLRNIDIKKIGNGGYTVEIAQQSVSLKHLSPNVYHIDRNYQGKTYGTETFQPSVELKYLGSGRTIYVVFAKCGELGNKLFPEKITICAGKMKLYDATISNIRLAGGAISEAMDASTSSSEVLETKQLYKIISGEKKDLVELYPEKSLSESNNGLTNRRRIKYNVIAAAYLKNWEALDAAICAYRNQLKKDGCEAVFNIYSLESITELCAEFCGEAACDHMAFICLTDVYRQCESAALKEHILRLLDQYRLGYAFLAIQVLKEKKPADAAEKQWQKATEDWLVDVLSGKNKDFAIPQNPRVKQQEKMNQLIFKHFNK